MSPDVMQAIYSLGQVAGLLHHRPDVRAELVQAIQGDEQMPERVALVRDLLTMVLADAGAEPSPLQ